MQSQTSQKPSQTLKITSHPDWAQEFWDHLIPYKNTVVNHIYFKQIQEGVLPIELCQKGLIDFYPLVENFPKYMALNLAKVKRGLPGHFEAKKWLIHNISVEQNHADWWHFWAHGFRIEDAELINAEPRPLMNAINDYLWNINTYGTLPEGIAATNLAVEWATGEWVKIVMDGAKYYVNRPEVNFGEKFLFWLKAHATYDDKHPYEAMEIIKKTAVDEVLRGKAFKAAKRAFELYALALDDCCR